MFVPTANAGKNHKIIQIKSFINVFMVHSFLVKIICEQFIINPSSHGGGGLKILDVLKLFVEDASMKKKILLTPL